MNDTSSAGGITKLFNKRNQTSSETAYALDSEACDEISYQIMDFCKTVGTERRNALRYRLTAEECLLYWMSHGLGGNRVTFHTGRYMHTPFIDIEVEGAPLNPFSEDDEDFGYFTDNILASLNLGPEYAYENGRNQIRFRIKKKPLGQIATLGIVMLTALLVGITGTLVFPAGVCEKLLEVIINPLYDTFFNILGCIAGPMVFLSVTWGVYGIGDAATLGKIGRKMMLRYVGTTMIVCACCAALFPILGPQISASASSEGQFASVAELVLDIFPSTIVEPFATGNTLQIIFLAIVIGIALLYLGKQTSAIAVAIEQVNLLVQFLMEMISKLVPYVIFLVVVNMVWSGSLDVLLSSWKLIVVLIAAFLAIAIAFLIFTSAHLKVNALTLAKKNLPTFLVALTTASSAAAFNSNVETCERKFGIQSSLVRFGIPLGMVMHKPICAAYDLLLTFFFAQRYGVSCSVGWIVVAVFLASIVAIATPPIPGGGAIAYGIIFAQMGIPASALTVALALDFITDFIVTAFEVFVLPLSLINISYGLAMIDTDVLAN